MAGECRNYDRAFKLETVRLITEQGCSASSVARDLGIHESVLRRWVKKYQEDGEHSFPGKGHLKPEDEELRRLRRRNAELGDCSKTFTAFICCSHP
ncbi:MAG: transposase [Firmicutes bacterium]|nr:transposase [Bacillota bacterium]